MSSFMWEDAFILVSRILQLYITAGPVPSLIGTSGRYSVREVENTSIELDCGEEREGGRAYTSRDRL
jgi:hypothetical protein